MTTPNYNVVTRSHEIDPKERARRLSRVYSLILSWPIPKNKIEPAADDLGRDAAAGSGTREAGDE